MEGGAGGAKRDSGWTGKTPARQPLLLAAGLGHEGDVQLHKVLLADAELELAKGLHKGHALNVANGAAQLPEQNAVENLYAGGVP